MATTPLPEEKPSGKVLPPPIYFMAGTATLRDGDHSHFVWDARVVHPFIAGHSLPMIVKAVASPVTLAVEVACGLAAKELRLNVPIPGLVVAEREDLQDIDDDLIGKRLLLVGSHYQRPDALFVQAMQNNQAAEDMVWERLCATSVARQGAAWDELIANPDRHCENVLFDGTTWWLFDHDQALAPAASYARHEAEISARQDAIAHNAKVNLLVNELLRRYAGQQQSIMEQSKRLDSGRRRLLVLATYARSWTHPDAEIQAVLELIGIVLGLIHLRLPALAEKLQSRVGPPRNNNSSLWI